MKLTLKQKREIVIKFNSTMVGLWPELLSELTGVGEMTWSK